MRQTRLEFMGGEGESDEDVFTASTGLFDQVIFDDCLG
jgi:hypothetical protein